MGFTIVLVGAAMIEELALKTLFPPVGVTFFLAVAAVVSVILWGPDFRRWISRVRRPDPELTKAIDDAEHCLLEVKTDSQYTAVELRTDDEMSARSI